MKFSIKNFFCIADQIPRKLQIWSYLLKKSLMESFIFCTVNKNDLLKKKFKINMWAVKFFEKQRFLSTQPQCCLTFSWIELQMLLSYSLIHLSMIILRHFLYLLYLCPSLDLGVLMSYLCDTGVAYKSVAYKKKTCSNQRRRTIKNTVRSISSEQNSDFHTSKNFLKGFSVSQTKHLRTILSTHNQFSVLED